MGIIPGELTPSKEIVSGSASLFIPQATLCYAQRLGCQLVCDEWRASSLPLALTWHRHRHISVILLCGTSGG